MLPFLIRPHLVSGVRIRLQIPFFEEGLGHTRTGEVKSKKTAKKRNRKGLRIKRRETWNFALCVFDSAYTMQSTNHWCSFPLPCMTMWMYMIIVWFESLLSLGTPFYWKRLCCHNYFFTPHRLWWLNQVCLLKYLALTSHAVPVRQGSVRSPANCVCWILSKDKKSNASLSVLSVLVAGRLCSSLSACTCSNTGNIKPERQHTADFITKTFVRTGLE